MDEMEMLPEWAGRRGRRAPSTDRDQPDLVVLEAEEESSAHPHDERNTPVLQNGDDVRSTEPVSQSTVPDARPTAGSSRRLILLLAVFSLVMGVATGFLYLLVAG